jgi:hypothetical protein
MVESTSLKEQDLNQFIFFIFNNKFLIIKAKYEMVVYLHWTPLLEPLSVLLPPQISNEFHILLFQKYFNK